MLPGREHKIAHVRNQSNALKTAATPTGRGLLRRMRWSFYVPRSSGTNLSLKSFRLMLESYRRDFYESPDEVPFVIFFGFHLLPLYTYILFVLSFMSGLNIAITGVTLKKLCSIYYSMYSKHNGQITSYRVIFIYFKAIFKSNWWIDYIALYFSLNNNQ